MTRRSKFLCLHDETVWPRRDHAMVGQIALRNAIAGTGVRRPRKKSHHKRLKIASCKESDVCAVALRLREDGAMTTREHNSC
jgi:hypothetical protein